MSKQYDEYLEGHIDAVKKAAQWMLDNLKVTMGDLMPIERNMFLRITQLHDQSKYSLAEYGPYDDYFYGTPDEDAFNAAWLHHIHANGHHWQHWVLVNDDGMPGDHGKIIALEMPRVFALEMVADWWSFSWRTGNLAEVFDWYDEHKDCMVLHENTRAYVEGVLDEIKERIQGHADALPMYHETDIVDETEVFGFKERVSEMLAAKVRS